MTALQRAVLDPINRRNRVRHGVPEIGLTPIWTLFSMLYSIRSSVLWPAAIVECVDLGHTLLARP